MTTMNPYAPPRTHEEPIGKPRAAFSRRAVIAHSILLSPLVGVGMVVSNWLRCGERDRALRTALLYGLLSLLVVGIQLANQHLRGIASFGGLGVAFALARDQSEFWDQYKREGVAVRSWWVATLYALVAMVGLFTALGLLEYVRPGTLGD
jgi:hypothetical protein